MWNYTPVGIVALLEHAGLRAVELRPGIDGFTLIAWRVAGGHRCFHRWWGRESPFNRALNGCGARPEGRHPHAQRHQAAVLRTVRIPGPARPRLDVIASEQPRAAPRDPDNLLDRLSRPSTMEAHYRQIMRREQRLLAGRLGIARGDVLSVGAGWHPGRHLFPAPAFRLVAVDSNPERVAGVVQTGPSR